MRYETIYIQIEMINIIAVKSGTNNRPHNTDGNASSRHVAGLHRYPRTDRLASRSRSRQFWRGWGITEVDPSLFREAACRVLDVVQAMAAEKGCTASQVALAWTAAQAGRTSVVSGPRTVAQAVDNLGAVGVSLTTEETK